MTGSLRTFHAFGRAPVSLSLESVPGGSSAAGSTCSRQVSASLPTPRESPARPSVQLSRGVGPEDAPRPLLARQRGLAKGSRAPRPRPPVLGGVRPGVPLLPPRAVGARGGCGRGACPPSWPEGVSGGIRPRGPPAHHQRLGVAGRRLLQKVRARFGSAAAPGATGAGTDSADRRSPWSSRVRAWRAPAAGAGGWTGLAPAVSRAPSRRPLEGCGPRRALSMVRPFRARLPRVALAYSQALSLPLARGPPRSRRSFLLSWVSPFVLSSPAGLFLFPLPPFASPPPSALCRRWGFRTVLLDIFGLCTFGEWMEFLLTWGRRPASHLLTKVPPVIKPPFILGAHTPHSFTSCQFIYCFFF